MLLSLAALVFYCPPGSVASRKGFTLPDGSGDAGSDPESEDSSRHRASRPVRGPGAGLRELWSNDRRSHREIPVVGSQNRPDTSHEPASWNSTPPRIRSDSGGGPS